MKLNSFLSAQDLQDRDLLERRKSPDLTPRESLLSIEVQTRMQILTRYDDASRDALLAECAALRAEILALDFNADGVGKINGVGEKAMALHLKAVEAK